MIRVGVATDRRRREHMEDRTVVAAIVDATLVAVFDGHGGAGVAEHAAARAVGAVEDALADGLTDHALWRRVFARLDAPVDWCGSTATLALLRDRAVSVGWVGDSRALLVDRAAHRALTRDHRLRRADERVRVRAAGAMFDGPYVVDPHTGQGLMMTRALGDRGLRHVGVVPDPECRATTVGPDDVAVVVATDGLWDVLAEPEVAVIARAEEDAEAAAARLVGAVIERDGPDNVAVVVARLA